MTPRPARLLACLMLLSAGLVPQLAVAQEEDAKAADEIALTQCLAIPRVGSYGRRAVHRDAIEAQIVAGSWSPPEAGESLTLPDGSTKTWQALAADEEGWFADDCLRGGYAHVSVHVHEPRVMLLDAAGHAAVYVNGEPRTGDPYANGSVRVPIVLRKGANGLLFHCGRGRLRARLTVAAAAIIDLRDATLPDLIAGQSADAWAAVVVINATTEVLDDLHLRCTGPDDGATQTRLPPMQPLSLRKFGFHIQGAAPSTEECELRLELLRGRPDDRKLLHSAATKLRVRQPNQTRKQTFISDIDGSVQYYAVNPASSAPPEGRRPALFLSLHGATVEAIGQARSYRAKSWGHIVAPTNRRPFGFDWEDWGRIDTLEVLDHASRTLGTDPARTYLTGHSMGGHGVWQIGALFPDRFAAIGPSAGWISFGTYPRVREEAERSPVQEMLRRASGTSETLDLERNYRRHGVYILHGENDDNVPVREARTMAARLGEFHHDFIYHEEPEVKHWWNISDEPGTDCVDWAPMFDLFARHTIPESRAVRELEFVTVNPGVSASCHWAGIEAQVEQLKPSSIVLRHDPGRGRIVGSASNVARLSIDLGKLGADAPALVELDGQSIALTRSPGAGRRIWLTRRGDEWREAPEPSKAHKGPQRYGPFKEAFRNRVQLVFGTRGTPDESRWARAKARFDGETFWYRGNGSVDVVRDVDFDPVAEPTRNVILYGNADTNDAWDALLPACPVQVRRGLVQVGERREEADDLACLFIRPRPGSEVALVGVVSGSGPVGMRLTNRLRYFVSGAGFPDLLLIGASVLSEGDAGIRAAGFFGLDWTIDAGEFAWQE